MNATAHLIRTLGLSVTFLVLGNFAIAQTNEGVMAGNVFD